jgi:hypothetical protein
MHSRLDARLRRLEAIDQAGEFPSKQGISALLAFARQHRLEPWDMPSIDADRPPTGLALLLAEARQWMTTHKDGAH